MKWFIYFLVVANLAFFLWQYRRGDVTTAVPRVADITAGPRLLLRHEADDDSLLPRGTLAQTDPSAADPATSDAAASSSEAAVQSNASQNPDATPASARAVAKVTLDRSAAMAANPRGMAQTCLAVGPFSADDPVADLLDWLQGNGAETTSRWSERETPSRYWVYLPPLETVEQARAVLRRLKDDGLQDYIRVMRGPMRNAISLGLFKQRDSAERRLAQLRAKGYAPELDIRYKSERVRWLDVAFPAGLRFPDAAFSAAFPAVAWTPAGCPAAGPIAGASAIP
ncbi:MAG: SPOR domain-containing protein [Gammaproteobacteria bacterium]|nr:SPOR domain-containing protein [Gammaproteobacteria bacterium]MDJ0891403.1 SPOR domain-containing protein [Gammaproteobacteria bacterium]